MERKKIIQISIVVIAFLISGIILYVSGVFGTRKSAVTGIPAGDSVVRTSGATGTPTSTLAGGTFSGTASGTKSSLASLPYGNTFNIDEVLTKYPLDFNFVQYPKLDPIKDIGVLPDNLITPQIAPGK